MFFSRNLAALVDAMNRLIEPGAPSAKRRLLALQKLVRNGFWTTARFNHFFPIYPDGYFTDPNFNRKNMPAPFHYSSFDIVDAVAEHGVPAILAGIVKLSSFSLNQIEKASGHNLRELYRDDTKKTAIFTEKNHETFTSPCQVCAHTAYHRCSSSARRLSCPTVSPPADYARHPNGGNLPL